MLPTSAVIDFAPQTTCDNSDGYSASVGFELLNLFSSDAALSMSPPFLSIGNAIDVACSINLPNR